MLVEEPNQASPDSSPPHAPRHRRSPGVILLLTLVALVVLVLRHDYWNWNTPYPLLFGFLPVGLWWQGLVSLLAAGMMWMMVHFAWPHELEDEASAVARQERRS